MRKFVAMGMLFTLLLTVGLVLFYEPESVDLAQYQKFIDPQLSSYPSKRMLVVTVKGDPSKTAVKAYDLLYATYLKIDGVDTDNLRLAPHARWEADKEADRSTWIGHFALPLADDLPPVVAADEKNGMRLQESEWAYGETAEILHIGPYEEQGPTLDRLKSFAKEQGYEPALKIHEEVYLKGPGLIFRGDEDAYQTLLRLPVRKVAPALEPSPPT